MALPPGPSPDDDLDAISFTPEPNSYWSRSCAAAGSADPFRGRTAGDFDLWERPAIAET